MTTLTRRPTIGTDTLVLPVGHYLGSFQRRHAWLGSHLVRVGDERVELTDAQLNTWLAAHGTADDSPTPFSTEALHRNGSDVDPHLDVLVERGAVARFARDDAETFARTHAVRPLMLGFGNLDDAPDEFRIGLPGIEAAAVVDDPTYQLWQWGAVARSLWEVCCVFADAAPQTERTAAITPTAVLTRLLVGLRDLLGASAAYVDVAPHRPDAA